MLNTPAAHTIYCELYCPDKILSSQPCLIKLSGIVFILLVPVHSETLHKKLSQMNRVQIPKENPFSFDFSYYKALRGKVFFKVRMFHTFTILKINFSSSILLTSRKILNWAISPSQVLDPLSPEVNKSNTWLTRD